MSIESAHAAGFENPSASMDIPPVAPSVSKNNPASELPPTSVSVITKKGEISEI